jgi:serine/threonine protein phosphatase PrpC
LLVSVKSEIGQVRSVNEDNYAVRIPDLFVVADGMGGHVAGEIASKLAIENLIHVVEPKAAVDPLIQLEHGIQQANLAVFRESQSETRYAGMGTTLTAVRIVGKNVYCGHVGDSRLYLFRQEQLCQLTQDHSLVWELARAGTISIEETRTHPQRNILTRAVGASETVQIDLEHFEWTKGDILMLCTDGLTNMIDDPRICKILSLQTELDAKLTELITAANQAGGYDNITVILIQNEDDCA